MAHVTEFVKEAEASIQSLKAELVTVEAMMPIEEMNMEEYFDAFPQKVCSLLYNLYPVMQDNLLNYSILLICYCQRTTRA